MADCKFCGKPAGILRRAHSECARQHHDGEERICGILSSAVSSHDPLSSIVNGAKEIAQTSFIDDEGLHSLAIRAWIGAVDKCIEERVITHEEEQRFTQLMEAFSITKQELEESGAYLRLVKALVIRDVLSGKTPERAKLDGNIPVNLQKDEKLVWLFNSVGYTEVRTHREYVGGSSGVSVRVMKGVYLRSSAFRGHPVDRAESVHVDDGSLIVTNKIFISPVRSKRFASHTIKLLLFILIQTESGSPVTR